MATINKTIEHTFGKENFPSLILREDLSETWNNIALHSLPSEEKNGLSLLLEGSGIANSTNFDPDRVLLVKAQSGILKQVYGPAIFRDGERAILKVGSNEIALNQSGDRYLVGDLKGKINVQTKTDLTGVVYPVAYCSFVDKLKNVFKVRIDLDTQNEDVSASAIEATLVNEESILPYLAQVPVQAIKMHELGTGEYEVREIVESVGEYGLSFKIYLMSGLVVWAKENSQILLERGYCKKPDTPLTLVISKIEEIGDGKWQVDNALRERLPRLNGASTTPNVPTLEAVAEEVEEKNLDELPF
jgi:hypothetical protein